MIELTPGKLWGMRRMADDAGRFRMTAVDQRPPIKAPIARHYGLAEAPWEDVARFKALLVETLEPQSSALLLDPHYAVPKAIGLMSPRKGLIVTLEDSLFSETPEGRFSAEIDDWSVEKIRRMGGDAVKVLAWYRPDAGETARRHQQDFVKRIGDACRRFDIPFLLELLVYPLEGDRHRTRDYVEMREKKAGDVLASVEAFAAPEYGVDLFKLESPLEAAHVPPPGGEGAEECARLFAEMGRLAGRPWVMLSAGAGKEAFRNVLAHAYAAGASGYLAGRAIWLEAFSHFPDWGAMRAGLSGEAIRYMRELNALTEAAALPWHAHPAYGPQGAVFRPADASFRHVYGGMAG